MSIVWASDGLLEDSRKYVSAWLDKKIQEDKNYCIIDVGGGANPWYKSARYIIDTIKSQEPNSIAGDINLPETWNSIRQLQPDFIICTHVLEDIRNPFYIMDEICRSAAAGYISFPTKHQEMSRIESLFYVGYHHHRWIYTLCGQELKVLAKMPLANYWASAFYPFRKLCSVPYIAKRLNRRGLFWPAVGDLPWLDAKKAREPRELGFLWENEFTWSSVNNDYAGPDYKKHAELYMYALRDGI